MSTGLFTEEEAKQDSYLSLYQATLDYLRYWQEREKEEDVRAGLEELISSLISIESKLPTYDYDNISWFTNIHDIAKAMAILMKEGEEQEKPAETKKILKDIQPNYQLFAEQITNKFLPLLNGTPTNRLSHIRKKPSKIDAITHEATIEDGNLKVFIEGYNEIKGLRTSTLKLLDFCTMKLTQQNHYRGRSISPTVTFALDEFMTACGVPLTKSSKDQFRRKVKEDLETLYRMSLEWSEPSGGNTRDFAKMRIATKIAFIRGEISFGYSHDMALYLTNAYLMQYPTELLRVDERNSNIYPLGRKLLLHNSIDNNIRKGTANIISVKALLEVCPDIPPYEEVATKGRQLDQRIKAPFEKALDALPFIRWEYTNAKGTPLTKEQQQAIDFATFEKLYIKFEVIGVPDQTARLQARTEEAKTKAIKMRPSSKKKKDTTSERAGAL